MRTFVLKLIDAVQIEEIVDVVSCVAEDASGQFGIQAGHERLMTALSVGLIRLRTVDGRIGYLAIPGAILYFCDNLLLLCTRFYLRGDDYRRLSEELQETLGQERDKVEEIKLSLRHMEEELFRSLWKSETKNRN